MMIVSTKPKVFFILICTIVLFGIGVYFWRARSEARLLLENFWLPKSSQGAIDFRKSESETLFSDESNQNEESDAEVNCDSEG